MSRMGASAVVRHAVRATSLVLGVLCSCTGGPVPQSPAEAPSPRASTTPTVARAEPRVAPDYLLLAPRAFFGALAPLVELHRGEGLVVQELAVEEAYAQFSAGTREPLALLRAVREAWQASGGKLRFLLVVGAPPTPDEPGELRVPTFYLPKLDYFDVGDGPRFPRHLPLTLTREDPRTYPSDHPFALVGSSSASALEVRPALAVGRLPARTVAEVSGFVGKLIEHEHASALGPSTHRLVVIAGQARFGVMIDGLLERVAVSLLDEQVPAQYDLGFVFAKPGSPYAYRFDRLGDKLVAEADAGALLLLYVGHSAAETFDGVEYRGGYYPIGTGRDFARMGIHGARPLFVSLSCEAGEYDLGSGRRSMAEEAVLNPGGPIAAFAASRESHPYPNLLYGEAFIAHFLSEHPATIGEGLLAAKVDIEERSSVLGELLSGVDSDELREEHVGLYNLLGDPATHLRYALPASLELSPPAPSGYLPSTRIMVQVRSELAHGTAEIRLETRRKVITRPQLPDKALDALPLPDALARMAENYDAAMDKSLQRVSAEVVDGVARGEIVTPAKAGSYVLKAQLTGKRAGNDAAAVELSAIGATTLLVVAAAAR
jgi:hypothetical protein